ncbi:NAD-dependent epimerase/dehydratase family protein [Kitasatospora sp. NPDC059795]|uniref:NAD-dependent epimerase/dehydratase family protein n=1 Tax=Kitasatospora sp. NPDC059795 TaxID=3346949 RepID=UPI0036550797
MTTCPLPAENLPGSTPVLVTGGAGFIGRHLALRLADLGHPVTVLDTADNPNALHGLTELAGRGPRVVVASTADTELMARTVREHPVVAHLAWPTVGVDQALKAPLRQVAALAQTAALAQLLTPEHTLLFASTSDIYGMHSALYEGKTMAEDDLTVYEAPGVGRWTYSKVKAVAESVIAESPARTVAVRIFNAYGPGLDHPRGRRVIAQFTEAVFAGRPMRLSGDGSQRRAFCYISDLVEGMRLALNHSAMLPEHGHLAVNLGNPDACISVAELAQIIADLSVENGFVTSRPAILPGAYEYCAPFTDTWHRRPDISRARTLLGFRPVVDLREGLLHVLRFHNDRTGTGV